MGTPSVHPRDIFVTAAPVSTSNVCGLLLINIDTLIGGAVASPTRYRGRYSESNTSSASPWSMEVETSFGSTRFLGRPRYVESLDCRNRFVGGRGFDLFFDREPCLHPIEGGGCMGATREHTLIKCLN